MIQVYDKKQEVCEKPIYIATINIDDKERHWYADSWYDFIKMWNEGDGPSGEDPVIDYALYNFFVGSQPVSTFGDLKKICDSAFEKGVLV